MRSRRRKALIAGMIETMKSRNPSTTGHTIGRFHSRRESPKPIARRTGALSRPWAKSLFGTSSSTPDATVPGKTPPDLVRGRGVLDSGGQDHFQLGLVCAVCAAACCSMFCRYRPTKSTGSSINGGKPPSRTEVAMISRANGNNSRGHSIMISGWRFSFGTFRIRNMPA